MKLIVVGDPHIDKESGELRGVDTAVHLAQLVQHINTNHAKAAYCLFMGNYTNEGELEAYERFKQLKGPLFVPSLLMVGNSDNTDCHYCHAQPALSDWHTRNGQYSIV